MRCCSIISQGEFEKLDLVKLIEKINEIPTISVKELRFSDLYQPRKSCHGIYIFKSPEGTHYFGKATGRCITDRIGAHFDSRSGGFLNSLLGKLACENTDEALHNAYIQILDWEFSVLFVEGEESEYLKKIIGVAERMLIYDFQHRGKCFNRCNQNSLYDRSVSLIDAINN